jgi:hypothetical protein
MASRSGTSSGTTTLFAALIVLLLLLIQSLSTASAAPMKYQKAPEKDPPEGQSDEWPTVAGCPPRTGLFPLCSLSATGREHRPADSILYSCVSARALGTMDAYSTLVASVSDVHPNRIA